MKTNAHSTMNAMSSPPSSPSTPVTKGSLALDRPDPERSAQDEPGLRVSLLRWLVSVANADGDLNLAEFRAICALAEEGGSAHELMTVLRAAEHPQPAELTLRGVKDAASQLDANARRQLLLRAMPVLRLQWDAADGWATALADALQTNRLTTSEMDSFATGAQPAAMLSYLTRPIRTLTGRASRSAAIDLFRMTGDSSLTALLGSYASGDTSLAEMKVAMQGIVTRLNDQFAVVETHLHDPAPDTEQARRDLDAAEKLFHQIGQRLAMVEARILADRTQFNEDFDEMIHDAGNAVELEMLDRLKTDDWTLTKVWDSMGRSTFAKELERRVDRLARRHERQLGLMKDDLRLFQDEYRLAQATVLQRTHHTKLSSLMPTLRASTRALNATESAADVTLVGGVVAGIGTGAAIYALGVAAVLPVIAPIAPFAGGALLVAGAVKWMMDGPGRMGQEVRDKRKAFEQALGDRLTTMRESYFAQLDQAGQEFLVTARVLARPLLLEAQARLQLQALEKKVAAQLLRRDRRAVDQLSQQLKD